MPHPCSVRDLGLVQSVQSPSPDSEAAFLWDGFELYGVAAAAAHLAQGDESLACSSAVGRESTVEFPNVQGTRFVR